jgi:uncharacterized protein (DUF1684 family)
MNPLIRQSSQRLPKLAALICLAPTVGCAPDLPLPDPDTHRAGIEAWQAERFAELREPEGWLSVVGLYWLESGANSFGADSSNDVVLPGGNGVPARAGSFILDGDTVRMEVNPGVRITHQGAPVGSLLLASDLSGRPTVARLGSLLWYVIERQELKGIRLKDTANAAIEEFAGVESFPVALEWHIPARFDRYDPPRVIAVPNVLGMVTEQPSPGAVVFRVAGKKYRLDVTGDPEAARFSLVFGDRTNGQETYGGGRFLEVTAPDERGRTFIDFNRAYNPPCVFTAFATCPLPPAQNRLTVRIEAGEKMYHGAGHGDG